MRASPSYVWDASARSSLPREPLLGVLRPPRIERTLVSSPDVLGRSDL